MNDNDVSILIGRFNIEYDECDTMIQHIGMGTMDRSKIDDVKDKMRGIEKILDEVERDAYKGGDESDRILESTARELRKKYNELVKSIMNEDSKQSYNDDGNAVFRRRSDLIFDNNNDNTEDSPTKEESETEEEFEDKPEEIATFKRNNRLERILIVFGISALVIFLFIYILVRYIL